MAQLLVRNVPDETVRALRERAALNGSSAEAEHRAILQDALGSRDTAWKSAAQLSRQQTRGRSNVPSWVLLREDRDSR